MLCSFKNILVKNEELIYSAVKHRLFLIIKCLQTAHSAINSKVSYFQNVLFSMIRKCSNKNRSIISPWMRSYSVEYCDFDGAILLS